MPVDTQSQIYGIKQSLTALTEKAEKLVSEMEQNSHNGKLPDMGNVSEQSKTNIMLDIAEQPKNEAAKVTLPWSYWQDDLTEVSSLINASLNLSEIGDDGGAFIVLSQAAKKANFLNTYMDSVNAGKTRGDVIARHNLEAVA